MPLLKEDAIAIANYFFSAEAADESPLKKTLKKTASRSSLRSTPKKSKATQKKPKRAKIYETLMKKRLQYGFQKLALLAFDKQFEWLDVDDLVEILTHVTGNKDLDDTCITLLMQVLTPYKYNLIIEKLIQREAKSINALKGAFMRGGAIVSKMISAQFIYLNEEWLNNLADGHLKPIALMVKAEIDAQRQAHDEQGSIEQAKEMKTEFTFQWTKEFCDQLAEKLEGLLFDVLSTDHIEKIPVAIRNICCILNEELQKHTAQPEESVNIRARLVQQNSRTDNILIKVGGIYFLRYLNPFIYTFTDPKIWRKLADDERTIVSSVLIRGMTAPLQKIVNCLNESLPDSDKKIVRGDHLAHWNDRLVELFSQNIAVGDESEPTVEMKEPKTIQSTWLKQLRDFLFEIAKHRFTLSDEMPVIGSDKRFKKVKKKKIPDAIYAYLYKQTVEVQSHVAKDHKILNSQWINLIESENYELLKLGLLIEPQKILTDATETDALELAWRHLNQKRSELASRLRAEKKSLSEKELDSDEQQANEKPAKTSDIEDVIKILELVHAGRYADIPHRYTASDIDSLIIGMHHLLDRTNQMDEHELAIEEREELEAELEIAQDILHLLAAHFVRLAPKWNPLSQQQVEEKKTYDKDLKRLMFCCLKLRDVLFNPEWDVPPKYASFKEAFYQYKKLIIWILQTDTASKIRSGFGGSSLLSELSTLGDSEEDIHRAFNLFIKKISPIDLSSYESAAASRYSCVTSEDDMGHSDSPLSPRQLPSLKTPTGSARSRAGMNADLSLKRPLAAGLFGGGSDDSGGLSDAASLSARSIDYAADASNSGGGSRTPNPTECDSDIEKESLAEGEGEFHDDGEQQKIQSPGRVPSFGLRNDTV